MLAWSAATASIARAEAPAPPPIEADGAAAAAGDDTLDAALVGSWYVLVHYRDTGGGDPEQLQWDDELWRFDAGDGRLVWTLHPHVSLRDRSGRFEVLPSGAEARTLGAWSPSPAQRDEIATRLVPDPREARRKVLRGSPADGFRSRAAARGASASMVAYGEQWSVEGPAARPRFVRADTLAAGRAAPAEGRTTFAVLEAAPDGDELRGEYRRDGRFVGRFRMTRIHVDGAGGGPR